MVYNINYIFSFNNNRNTIKEKNNKLVNELKDRYENSSKKLI